MTAVIVGIMISPTVFASPTDQDSLCAALTRYRPDPSVDYKPGVDVHGNPVAPADLPGGNNGPLAHPNIAIPLTLDLAKRLNLNPNAAPANALGPNTQPVLGILTLDSQNRLLLDGQPVDDDAQAHFAEVCGQGGKKP